MGGKERRVFRNNYKGHMDKTMGEGGIRVWGRWGWLELVGGVVRGKCKLYLNNNKIKNNN